ncbi:hypothetical protein BDV93DRAFT_545566 [Ceratobasidium sp. AG-I]|nr:hypothetical protein BDV93DRAFT_545566 [Ceratobasidium sp. AG-I]
MAELLPDSEVFQHVVYHIFLPPQLPQEAPNDIHERQINLQLVRSIIKSAGEYSGLKPSTKDEWDRVSRMLAHMERFVDIAPSADRLQRTFSEMQLEDVLSLHIRAQNAAVLVRKGATVTIFEVFEVQAPNEALMSIPGKLVRSFPGRAVEVSNLVAQESGFFAEIANFLVRMDNDILPESTATTTKAGSEVDEVRDSAHPHYISQLFIGILRGMGKEFEPRRVVKRIADEVLWDNAYKPWHRSPIWLIIRVALQTSLPSPADYKHFMVYLEARLLHPEFVVDAAKEVTEQIQKLLEARWSTVQQDQERSPEFNLATCSYEDSTKQSLKNSRSYLEKVFQGRSSSDSYSKFTPNAQPRLFDVKDFAEFNHDALSSAFSDNSHVALFDFEESVHNHLSSWTDKNLEVPAACGVVASCLNQYTTLALQHYTMDVSDKSIMVLTIMELWVALDRLATVNCPLLLDYSPEIGEDLIETLLLRTALHISQAGVVQRYLRQRYALARQSAKGSVFSDQVTSESLAVRYFRQSKRHQSLKKKIEQEADLKKVEKLKEMRKQNEKHRELVARASGLEHEYSRTGLWSTLTHDRGCEKCSVEDKAENMEINHHEWPLPSSQLDAELVVFELDCPEAIRVWRDETYKILCDIASLDRDSPVDVHCTVSGYSGLRHFSSSPVGTITIASFAKSFLSTHYSAKIPIDESRICVNNGLIFKLYNTSEKTWAASPFQGTTFAKFGTLKLPTSSPYRHLQHALQGTSHTSNQVISNQVDCLHDLTLHEYIAFGTLRSGPRLQWMNIARGLEENSLTFSRNEVYLLHAQAAWQIGSLAEGGYIRDWHLELENEIYGTLLVQQSTNRLNQVKANWFEAATVQTLIMLVIRLLASNQNPIVYQDAFMFLEAARKVASQWLSKLLIKLELAEIDSQILDYQERVCEMAAIYRSTYDVEPADLEILLLDPDNISAFITCSINLYDNQPPQSRERLQSLLSRDRRIAREALPVVIRCLNSNPLLLNQAVSQLWPSYCASSAGWTSQSGLNSRWASTTTGGDKVQLVHLNLLDGRLLIYGQLLGRLPQDQKVLNVVPASLPGMKFTTRAHVRKYQIHFALDTVTKALLVQAQKDGRTYELVPHTVLAADFPSFFTSDYHHWANLESEVIEFRPLAHPWETSPRNWQLKFSTIVNSVMELATDGGTSLLTDIHSSLFQSICRRLDPLESWSYLHVTYSPTQQIVVKLPRMNLSFFVNDERALESHNMHSQVVDENQSSGTMLGLRNQLLLRAKDPAAQNLPQSRTVLIPHGTVQFSNNQRHTSVCIEVGTDQEVSFYQYKVDTDLGYLASTTGLTGRLFKIYLHAVTSHCLPDPLTGRTGTEEALYELSEPATSSFEQINREQAKLLKLISALTPAREHYPAHLQSMQTVHWVHLPSLSQHYAFATATESILCRANGLRLFHPLEFDPMSYAAELEPTLLERAAHRSKMYYPAETTARLPTILDGKYTIDHTYTGRDCSVTERAHIEQSAAWASNLACSRWSEPTYTSCDLVTLVESWEILKGPSEPSLGLTYSSGWLKLDLPICWLSIYNLCRHASVYGDRFKLSTCLASAIYSKSLPENLLHALLAFANNPAFRNLDPPSHSSYRLTDGYKPDRDHVKQLVIRHTRNLDNSPAGQLTSLESESMPAFRQRRCNNYDTELLSLRPKYITSLMNSRNAPQDSSAYSSWFMVGPCHTAVREYFASCLRNTELRTYLQNLERTLTSGSSTPGLDRSVMLPKQLTLQFILQPTKDSLALPGLQHLMQSSMCSGPGGYHFWSGVSVEAKQGDIMDTACLSSLLGKLQSDSGHSIQSKFTRSLEASRKDLAAKIGVVLPRTLPSLELLNRNRQSCLEYLSNLFVEIRSLLGPSTAADHVLSVAGLWPCRTPRSILRRLTLWARQSLPDVWRDMLLGYAQAFVEYQRSQRFVHFALQNKHEEFFKEVDPGCAGPSVSISDPDWLLVQIDGNFRARDVQARVANEMITPSSGANTVLQLNMGEGKSSVIVPIIAATLADSSRLVRVVVLKPLWRQMFQLLVSRLAGLAGRRVYYLPFGRHIRLGSVEAERVQGMYEECMREGGILLVQPEHILSFKLMGIDRLISSSSRNDKTIANSLRSTQDWLIRHSRDILDESDEILHVRYQLVYTVGQQQPLQDHPDRWTTTQQILLLVSHHISSLKKQFPDSLKFEPGSGGQFPFIQIMPDANDAVKQLILAVARDALDGLIPNLNFMRLSPSVRKMALKFLIDKEFPKYDYCSLKDECDLSLWKGMLLLRGLLASGVLTFALKEKRYRVDYGIDPSRSHLAVPYRAKDFPSSRAEFGNPDVAIVLTCLSYYYHGLTDTQLDTCFEMLYKLDNPTLEYEQWVHANGNIPQELLHLNGVNVKDREQFADTIIPAFSHNAAVVNFFLAAVVFPRETQEFPHKLATSGWDLAQVKGHVTTGFSGTNDNQYLLPTSIVQADPVNQSSTNALVLNYLLQPENNHYTCTRGPGGETCSAKDFLKLLVKQDPEIRVLLDVGAQMLELKNKDLVRCWLDLRPDVSAAVFFSDKDELMVLPQNGAPAPLLTSSFAQQLDNCIVYLDDGHTRGTDLKLPKHTRAVVTLGQNVTKDRLLQGCMRMRKLGHGQSVMFFAPPEIDIQIRKAGQLCRSDHPGASDVLHWAILETCNDLSRHISQWAQQGLQNHRVSKAEERFNNIGEAAVLEEAWILPESRTLEEMYGISDPTSSTLSNFISMAKNIEALSDRLDFLGINELEYLSMNEEQERGVAREVQRGLLIERPPKRKPASHSIHHDLTTFIRTGSIQPHSTSMVPLSGYLQQFHSNNSSAWSKNLLATADFSNAIADSPHNQLSDCLRPLNWILSSQNGVLLALSPYEVNALLPQIRTSEIVQLHIYSPRVNQSMRSLSDLRFFTVPTLSTSSRRPPSPIIQIQLNLWGGQLYLSDYNEYRWLCAFLGILLETDSDGEENIQVQGDGFVNPVDRQALIRYRPEYAICNLQSSQINMLRELIGRRRNGMGYIRTHLGQILHARQLSPDDFKIFMFQFLALNQTITATLSSPQLFSHSCNKVVYTRIRKPVESDWALSAAVLDLRLQSEMWKIDFLNYALIHTQCPALRKRDPEYIDFVLIEEDLR